MTSKNTSKEHIFPKFYQIVDTIKDKSKHFVSIFSKYSFSEQTLKSMYQYICGLIQSKYLSAGELITVLKSISSKLGLKWIWEC